MVVKGFFLFDCINNIVESNRIKCIVVVVFVSCCCFIVVVVVIVLGFGVLFMFVCFNVRL